MPSDIAVDTDAGESTALVTWAAPTASDNVGVTSFSSSHASGDAFPLGVTTVTYTARDAAGNETQESFTVTVSDAEAPVISGMPSDILTLTDPGFQTAVVTWAEPAASDNVAVASFTSSHSPGDTFPVGVTTVTYTATDDAGNQSQESFTITVELRDPDPAQSGVVASPDVIMADGVDTSLITVSVRDDTGTLLGRGGNTVLISTTLGTIGAITDHGDGTYSATLTAGTRSGVAEVTATIDGTAAAGVETVTLEPDAAFIESVFNEVTQEFIQRRMDRILSLQPTGHHFDNRRAAEPGTRFSMDINGVAPGLDGSLSLQGVVGRAPSGHLMLGAADTGGAAGDLSMNVQSISSDRRWHSWLEARFSIYEDGTGDLAERNGRFAIAHVGADYLVNEDLAIGVMAQGDWSSEDIDRYSDIEGRGWMIGPYVSGAFSETLFFTGRLAWVESTNDASIDVYDDGNIWSGTFSTERLLAAASIYGVYELGEVQFSPQVDLAYIGESIASYRVSDGAGSVTIESDDLSLLRMSLSGEIEWLDAFPLIEASAFFIPSLDWDIASKGLTTGDDGVRGGVEFGLRSTQGAGWRGEASIAYDGIGQTNFNAWTLRVGAEWHF